MKRTLERGRIIDHMCSCAWGRLVRRQATLVFERSYTLKALYEYFKTDDHHCQRTAAVRWKLFSLLRLWHRKTWTRVLGLLYRDYLRVYALIAYLQRVFPQKNRAFV